MTTALWRHGSYWVLEAPPHILLRAKRVFAAVHQQSLRAIRLSDTTSHARDLEWFSARHPLDMNLADRRYLKKRARADRDRETLVETLLGAGSEGRPFELALPPRDYQRQAATLALASRGTLIADELGLGKTVTAIACLTDPSTRPALVVCPTPLQRQWRDQLNRFAPGLRTHILKKTTPYDYTLERKAKTPHPDVLIGNYQKLSGWAETLSPLLRGLVFDEVHELRTGPERGYLGSKKGSAAKWLSEAASFRLGLSATPIFNYGEEIFWVLDALCPGVLGTFDEFDREWCQGGGRVKDPEAFGAYLREAGLCIRRTRSEVGRELPELIKVPHEVESDRSVFDECSGTAAELARLVLSRAAGLEKGEVFRAGGQLDAMMRQATGVAKAPYVAEFVRLLLEAGERVLLFGWHHAVYDIWMERLKSFKPALYTGRESEAGKHREFHRFTNKETPLLIMSLRSGAGLDALQYADCHACVFGELDWSPAVHEQDAARLHRDGQTHAVVAYYLISAVGSDPVIADVLRVKRAQLEGIRDPGGGAQIARLDASGAHIQALARAVLLERGESLPSPEPDPGREGARADREKDLAEATSAL